MRTSLWVAMAVAMAGAVAGCGNGPDGEDSAPQAVQDERATPKAGRITLSAPEAVAGTNRIALSWTARGKALTFSVLLQRSAQEDFVTVAEGLTGRSTITERGPAWKLDFPTARVKVRGCTRGKHHCVDSNEQPLLDVLLAGVVQLNPSPATQPLRVFGHRIALSADGNTLAAAADDNEPPQPGQGTIQVFQRGSDGRWSLEARLERFAVEVNFGDPFALSGDGQTLVVGAYSHTGTVGGINPPEANAPPPAPGEFAHWTGAIYVFTRDAAERQWTRQAFIKAAVPVADESFGFRVAVSHDGNRALVAASTRMYFFERTNGQWQQTRTFDSGPGFSVAPFAGMALSADGRSIAVTGGAFVPGGPPKPGSVTVYKQSSDGWRLVAELPSARIPSTARFAEGDGFGRSVSLSGDGTVLAVGAPLDPGDGPEWNTAPAASGAVYIFGADSSDVWQRRAFLKARTALPYDQVGTEVALSGDGKVLAAKACGFAANAQGLRRNHRADATIGQEPGDNTCFWGGSSYVFEQSADGMWSHTAAAIPAPGELAAFVFFSLALSADAQTLGLGLTSYANGVSHSRVLVY